MTETILLTGDSREVLRGLPDNCIQSVVTSPPYYGLRDYGTATWEGGNPDCDHKQTTARHDGGRSNTNGFHGSSTKDSDKGDMNFRDICKKCGAIRIDKQIGLETTPEEYVANLMGIFHEVWRVLKPTGTLWINIGDSYAATNMAGLKPKDLIGIPWMLAFALRADGWYLRSEIIWHKLNPMTESVKDRPTKSHEALFLLTKVPKYDYDYESIQEIATGYDGRKDTKFKHSKKDIAGGKDRERWKYKNLQDDGQPPNTIHLKRLVGGKEVYPVRNKRDVWPIATQPYKGAHFAVMPEKLVEPCILAGSQPGDIILDPFSGAGTVGVVSKRLGRSFIGIDLNESYTQLSRDRIKQS